MTKNSILRNLVYWLGVLIMAIIGGCIVFLTLEKGVGGLMVALVFIGPIGFFGWCLQLWGRRINKKPLFFEKQSHASRKLIWLGAIIMIISGVIMAMSVLLAIGNVNIGEWIIPSTFLIGGGLYYWGTIIGKKDLERAKRGSRVPKPHDNDSSSTFY